MTRKNDFMYYSPSDYYQELSYVVLAGGRLRIPVWLLWVTWGIIAAVIFIWETVAGIVSGTYASVFPYKLTTSMVVGTVGIVAIFWALVGLGYVLRAWIEAFKGLRR